MHKECGTSGGSKPVCIGNLRMGLISHLQQVDLDRTYIDGGVTVGGGRDTDSCFSLGASLLSGVPCIGCDLVGYLQQEHFLLSNQGTPLASCGSKNPATPLPHFLWAQCCQWPPLLSWHHLQQQFLQLPRLLGWSPETRGLCCTLDAHGVLDSSGQCAPACYSCSRSEVGSWTSYDPSPWVAGLQPVCCWGRREVEWQSTLGSWQRWQGSWTSSSEGR